MTLIPQKIQPYFRTTLQNIDGDSMIVEGMLTCCDSHEFEVYVFGEIKHNLFSKMYLYPKDDRLALLVRCKKCDKIIFVFDSNCDGYEQCGKHCNTHITTKSFACKKCMDNNFGVNIRYEYPDIQELEELAITQADNAYTWIWIALECNKCGTEYSNFIDFETA